MSLFRSLKTLAATGILLSLTTTPQAEEAFYLVDAFKEGHTDVSFRLRHENAKQASLRTAKATTLRTQVRFKTADFYDFAGVVEVVDVTALFGQRYNNTVQGLAKPTYTAIADPKGTGLTQAHILYRGLEATELRLGRQYISLDNERFLGKSDFRQFPQSFDAFTFKSEFLEWDLFAGFAYHFNTTKGNGRTPDAKREMRTYLVNTKWKGFTFGHLTGYGYFFKDVELPGNSHWNIGLSATASPEVKESFCIDYRLEAAIQKGKFNNPNRYSAMFYNAEIASQYYNIFTGKIGYARLGGHSTATGRSFMTPHATNQKFHGYADGFVTTPARGLQDYYIHAKGHNDPLYLFATYHYFRFANGSGSKSIGHEYDIGAGFSLSDHFNIEAAYAKLNSKVTSTIPKVRRVWVTLSANF